MLQFSLLCDLQSYIMSARYIFCFVKTPGAKALTQLLGRVVGAALCRSNAVCDLRTIDPETNEEEFFANVKSMWTCPAV